MGLKQLTVKNTSGDIKIENSSDAKAYISADKRKFAPKDCQLLVTETGDELKVEILAEQGWFTYADCEVNLSVKVPASTLVTITAGASDLELKGELGSTDFRIGSGNATVNAKLPSLKGQTGSGEISVKGQPGNIFLRTGSGDIELALDGQDSERVIELKTGSGDIELTGVSGRLLVNTGSGDVTATYKAKAETGEVDIKTGSGDAVVYLNQEIKASAQLKTGSGKVINELGQSDQAQFRVSMKTGSGDIQIKKLKN